MPTLNLVAKAYFLVGLIASALIFAVPDVYAANRVILGNASATALAASTDAHTTQTLKSLRSKVGKEGKIRVIVGVRAAFAAEGELSAADVTQQRNEIAAKQLAVQGKISSLKASKDKIKTYSTIPFMALEVDATELEALAGQTDITSIEEDRIVHATLAGSVPLIGGTAAWSRGYTGAGQTVAILDTGVDKAHPFLTGKVVSEACYSTNSVPAGATSLCPGGVTKSTAAGSGVNCDPALAGCFHGTHVAGIAAGAGASFSGVAKNASMIAMQIFSRFTSTATCGSSTPCIATYTSDYNLALERVFALRSTYSIAAVNMSIGGGGYSNQATCDADYSATKTVIDNLRSVNIATIIASGNESLTNQISAPGCISTAISVGATSKADVVASYSNSASFLKLLAPGSSITSSYPGSAYATASGTSMAAPHVAGAWALLKQQNATRSVTDTLSLLTATGVALTDAKSGVTTPRIRLDVALNAVPTLSYSSEIGYGTVGVSPASGTSSTLFTYKVIYTDAANTPPTLVRACIDGVCNTMSADASAATTLRDSSYINGEQYVYSTSLAAGTHAYYFTATDGTTTVNLPASGSLTSPTVSSLTIVTSTLPEGTVGAAYSQTLAATGGLSPYSWSSTTLPAGLGLSANGVISGSPTATSLTGFSASVTDAASATFSKALSISVGKATPIINCSGPVVALAFVYPMPLSTTQLNCSANVPGSFVYSPGLGTVLNAGSTLIMVSFAPIDTANYSSVTGSLNLVVYKGTPIITWPAPAAIIYPTALSVPQLNATANIPGSFTYLPVLGTVLSAGSQLLSANFTPFDLANYNNVSVAASLTVNKVNQIITLSCSSIISLASPGICSATASSGLPVTLISTTPDCTLSGSIVSAASLLGFCTIAAYQAGDANYNSAPTVAQNVSIIVVDTFNIITPQGFLPATVIPGGTTIVSASASSGLLISFSSSTSTVCSVGVSTLSGGISSAVVTALSGGNCTIAADQAGNATYEPAFTVTQNIAVAGVADLVMSVVSKTVASVGVGASFGVSSSVLDQGTAAAGGSTVGFYLSLDNIITSTDIRLTATRVISALAAGANSGILVTTVTVPYAAALGVYYVGACADMTNLVIESNETNNCKAATGTTPVTIKVVRNVDLQMTAVSKIATVVGQTKTFTIPNTVKNVGTTPVTVPSFMVSFYLSKDPIITTLDIKIGSRVVSRLMAGQSSTAITTVTVPGTVLPGVYYVGACADSTNVQIEATLLGASLEGNNCKAALGIINVVRNVDLVVSALSSLDTTVVEGLDFTISNTVKNVGTAAMLATPITTTKFYLSTDAIITSADTLLLGTRTVAGLAAGASSQALTVVTLPISVLPGVYYIGAIADSANLLLESIETNNSNSNSPTPTSDMITIIFDPTP